MNIQNIKKEKITDQVFNTMKSMILDGTWPVGEKIPSEAALAAHIAKLMQHRVFVSPQVHVAAPGALPRSMGKSKRVTDKRF